MLPILLQPGAALSLSDEIYSKTGCFPFFCPSKYIGGSCNEFDNVDRFFCIINGLYIVYHDFGRKFIDFFVRKDEQHTLKNHINAICKIRSLIAHGSFNSVSYQKNLEYYFKRYYGVGDLSKQHEDGYFGSLNESDWGKVCQNITNASNRLYEFLSGWSENDSIDIADEFHKDIYFKNSFDQGLIRQILGHMRSDPIHQIAEEDKTFVILEKLFPRDKDSNKGQQISASIPKKLYDRQDSQKKMFNKLVDVLYQEIYPEKANPTNAIMETIPLN